ncbi:MAG: helix-turn-helix domain-containing protein [Alphaproteobacteria bacterium]|nr:helix-turn-helix domain-containing protein [Alphaproteobacteria bacterium]
MGRKTKLLTDIVVSRARIGLEEVGKSGAIAIKLRIVLAAQEHGISAVCNIMGVTKASVISWIKALRDGSFETLSVKPGRGRKPLLSPSQQEEIRKWLESDPQLTIEAIQQKISKTMQVKLGRSTVHRLIKKMRFSYITRPVLK